MKLEMIPLKYLVTEVKELNSTLAEENLLSLSYGRVVPKDINSNEGLLPESFSGYNVVRPGDLVLRLTDMQNDQRSLRSGLVTESGIITSAYLTLRPGSRIDPRYLAYWFLQLDASKRLYALGGGLRQSVGFDELGMVAVPLPVLAEQRRVADFLDGQVALIDSLKQARTQQSSLLKEELVAELQRLIWDAVKLTIPVKFQVAGVTSGPRGWGDLVGEGGDRAFLRIGNLAKIGIDPVLNDLARVSPEDSAEARRASVIEGDVLIGITASIGDVAYISRSLAGSAFSQHVARLRPVRGISGEWLAWALQTHGVRERLTQSAYGGTKIGLGLAEVANVRVPHIEPDRQVQIATECRHVFGTISEVSRRVARSGVLLEELMHSMISAAVSGEFDVSAASGGRVLI